MTRELFHRIAVIEPPLDLDTKPQGLGIGRLAVVQAPDIKLGSHQLAALKKQGGEVVTRDRVCGVEFVRTREADLGLYGLAGLDLA